MSWKGEILLDDEIYPTQLTNVSGAWKGEVAVDPGRFSDREDIDVDGDLSAACSLCGGARDQCGHWRVTQQRSKHTTSSSAIGRSSSPIQTPKRRWLVFEGSLSISPSSSPSPIRKLHGVARAICRLSPVPGGGSRSLGGSPRCAHAQSTDLPDGGTAMERASLGTDSESEKDVSRDGASKEGAI